MKKLLYTLSFVSLFAPTLLSQTPASDQKVRFGLRITPQPTWLSSSDKNNTANGAKFGFGFGLNLEFKFSDIASIQTGIGGDFEGAKYKVKYDPANSYVVNYWADESGEIISPASAKGTKGNTLYTLKERNMHSTFITVPIILKLSTKEYSGLKYFGMFGGELGFRLKGTSSETYYSYGAYTNDTTFVVKSAVESTETGIDVTKELVPVRLAFNAGIGAEYRLAGSTAVFMSLNFFRTLTPYMYNESSYLYYRSEKNSTAPFKYVKQNLALSAFKINIGIMF